MSIAFPPAAAIELESLGSEQRRSDAKFPSTRISIKQPGPSSRRPTSRVSGRDQTLSPTTSADPLNTQMSWNRPKINMARLPLLFFDFIVFGLNDGAYGALLPTLESYYDLSYTVVSLIFLAPFLGYTLAALISSPIHMWGGQRAVAWINPLCRLITYIVMACHPPYPVVVVFLTFAGIGNGLSDSAWNAYLGDIKSSNEILGIMHGCYGVGALISPLIVTSMLDNAGLPWWTFYYIMIGIVSIDGAIGLLVFWEESGEEFRRKTAGDDADVKGRTRQSLKQKVTWLVAAFLLFYVGTEVSIGGWIITFMTQVRHGEPFKSSLTATGFWLGLSLGRVTLGFVTPKIGERLAVTIYLLIAIALQLIFWLVPSFVVSAVVVALQGYFIAPLFPAAVVAAAKLLPKKLHVSAIGISSAIGGAGAALLPFLTGVIVQSKGVTTLQPILLAFFVCQLAMWLLLPKIPRDLHED